MSCVRSGSASGGAAGIAGACVGEPTRRRTGPGQARARHRHSVERRERAAAARLDGRERSDVLRRDAHRDRSDGVLLSWTRQRRRFAAATRVCRTLAFAPACAPAANRVDASDRSPFATPFPRPAAQADARRHRLRVARVCAALPAAAAPIAAQPAVARASSVVRARGARRATRARAEPRELNRRRQEERRWPLPRSRER